MTNTYYTKPIPKAVRQRKATILFGVTVLGTVGVLLLQYKEDHLGIDTLWILPFTLLGLWAAWKTWVKLARSGYRQRRLLLL